MNRRLLLGAIALLGSGYLLGRAREKPNDTAMSEVQQEPAESPNVALQGYDPVAYFTRGRAVPGDRRISAEHNGVTYHFSNADDRDMFLAQPDKYAPQYGGFCAYGTAHDLKLTGDPELWDIVDGKLYLVNNREALQAWRQQRPSYISRADAIWARVQARRAETH